MKSNFRWLAKIALITIAILLVPLVAMQFSDSVDWSVGDFVVAAVLLFATALALDLVIAKIQDQKRKIMAVGLLAAAFLFVWAELTVGVFGD
ncbi:MAG TPA: hypothetical protein VFT49_00275 [Candidatus Saccharimonadales bacterium]|nr:hypothetical protein [Candidatus Saccharimonadales bacterium]